jgi:integrase
MIGWRARTHQQCDSALLLTYQAKRDNPGTRRSPDTYATWLLRKSAGMETVKELLGHASITTTVDTYGNPRELHQTGAFAQVAW